MRGEGDLPPAGAAVAADRVSVRLGPPAQSFEAVQAVSFDILPGEFVCLLGPSGCGKSTLLGALAGHVAISAGSLGIDGAAIAGPGPDRGMVFQHHTLFPWKRVLDNVAFGPKMRGIGKADREAQALDMLRLVGLETVARHYPSQLSGGMQQRVEIARALVNRPRLLLMDEPFGALDAQTRMLLQARLLSLWQQFRPTVVFVTHDIEEALFLGDRVLMMSTRPGRIVEAIEVPFPRPRPAEMTVDPAFVGLKRHCLRLLRADGTAEF